MKTFLLTLFFLTLGVRSFGQQPKWMAHKSLSYLEYIYKTTYVSSTTNPFVVNYLNEQPQNMPNAPVNDPIHHLIAYDTSGVELWTKDFKGTQNGFQFSATPLSIITKSNDKFWAVFNPVFDTLKVGNTILHSNYNDSLYYSYFFVEINRAGAILNYFVVPFEKIVSLRFGNVLFDGNRDFILSGLVEGDYNQVIGPLFPVPFSFGSFSTTIQPGQSVHFVAKVSANGSPANFFDFRCRNIIGGAIFSNYSVIQQLSINSLNGNILFAGMLGDTLAINSNTMINTTNTNQLFLGMLDNNLNYLSSKSETVATSGTFLTAIHFNPVANAFYISGSWDGFLSYGQITPIPGCIYPLGNDSYVAKLLPNSLNVDVVIPVFPSPNSQPPLAMTYAIASDPNGSIYFVGAGEDSLMQFGSKTFQTNTSDYLGFIVKASSNLQVDTALFVTATGQGNGRFNCIDFGNNSAYIGGGFNGTYHLGTLGFTSVIQADAALLRIDMDASAVSGFTTSPAPICPGAVVTPTNTTWGQPTPTYTWSAIPANGVSFSPNNHAVTPNITFSGAGIYTISCSASNLLGTSTVGQTQIVSNCTSINENTTDKNIIVKPNPSSGIFEIEIPLNEGKTRISVTDYMGITIRVFEYIATNNSITIDLVDQKNGIYFLNVERNDRNFAKKLILNK